MQERRSLDPATLLKGGSKPEGKIAAIDVVRQGSPKASAKSASPQQCKVFVSKEDTTSMASKMVKSSETSKMSGCNREKGCDPPSTVENCAKTAKSNCSSSKAEAPHPLSKPLRQNCPAKADATQPASARSNDSAPAAGIWKNCSNSNDGFFRRATREDSSKGTPTKVSKEISPKPANSLAHLRSFSLSLNAEGHKKLPPIKTSSFKGPSSAKNTANLCSECKAEAEGAVCFIGNDGRVSACTARNAIRLCKNLKCANHNPELLETGSAAAGSKKYLISRRHSLNIRPRTAVTPNGKNEKPLLAKEDAQALSHKVAPSPHGASAVVIPHRELDDDPHGCNEFDMKEEIEDNEGSQDDLSAKVVESDGTASASPHSGRSIGQYQRMRRRSFNVIEAHAPAELVILRKQMMQERKQAEEWMLDYAIEEALQKLVPSKDSKVKALVEAFESIMPSKEADAGTSEVGNHQSEGPKTPCKMAIKA